MSLLNKLLPPPLTNPFFRTPGQALDAVIRPIQQQTGIPGSYQYIEQGIKKLLQPKPKESPSYYGPAYASSEALGIKPGGPRDYGPGYKEKELAEGQRAENFRRGPGFPGQSPADRAYEAEKSRVAQLTAQDPELQRYEKAREAAKTQEEMNAARDIGMQIWAQKNPGLAAKVKPGQSGYDVIQGTLAGQAAAQGYGYQMPQQITMTPPPGVNVPQGLPAVQSFGASEAYGSKGLNLDPEIAKKFEELLNQAKQ